MVDTQQTQASKQNIGEASFALANAALNSQMFQLGTTWPKDSATAYPSWCTSTGGAGAPCPDASSLSQSFTGAEYATTPACSGGITNGWRTAVRDNGGGGAKDHDPAGG